MVAAPVAQAQISRPAGGAGVAGGVNEPAGGDTPAPAPAPVPAPAPAPAPAPVPPPAPVPVPPPPPAPVPPPPPPPAKAISYYIAVNGQTTGPFDEAGLKARVASGELTRTSMVWTAGMADWAEASTVVELQPILASAPPPAKFDGIGFMTGTWRSDPVQVPVPNFGNGTLTGRATYGRDGTYSYYGELVIMMQGSQMSQTITAQGTFTATEQGKNAILLKPNGTITFNMAGQPPATQVHDEPELLTIIDQNTLADSNGNRSYRVGN